MQVEHHVVGDNSVETALQTVLASEIFSRSQQLSRLLKYLCDRVISNTTDRISEYSIGTDVLGRPPNFDPTQDAAVRVEMHRLRRRLKDYYETQGAADKIRIALPQGRYAPIFIYTAEKDEAPLAVTAPVAQEEPIPAESSAVALIVPPVRSKLHGAVALFRRTEYRIGFAILAILIGVVAVVATTRRQPLSAPGVAYSEPRTVTAASLLTPPASSIRIGCGRPRSWTDRLGQVWESDQYFTGGHSMEFPIRNYVAATYDPHIFEAARTGSFTYNIPLPARTYEMHLYFIEPVYGPNIDLGGEGNRMFNLTVNGQPLLERFDILADANGAQIADVRVFKDITPGPDGYLHLAFESVVEGALVNAIELVPSRPHIGNPVRILPQNNFYTDSTGNLWTPDNFSIGGRVAVHPGPVHNSRDQEIFRHERYGHFQYKIPVDHGSYSLFVYMSEEYWGPSNPGGGAGLGTRLFDIYCNGVALLRNLDLYKEAGPDYASVRVFRHLTPNSQGKLDVSFVPVHDYASMYAIEVLDEAGPDVSSSERIVDSARAR